MADQLIASIRKNAPEELRIALSEFSGQQLASLRIWYTADDGTMRPGNKGLTFKLAMLPQVIEALQAADAEALRLGLLNGVSQ